MRAWFIILVTLSATSFAGNGQSSFRTVVPQQPVVAGESFLVQYVLNDPGKATSIRPPVFKGMRLVNGPNIYSGTVPVKGGKQEVRNFVYTVEAINAGKFRIPGTSVISNGAIITSNNEIIEVITPAEATLIFKKENISGDYFLRPGEDPYEKMRQNLFLRVSVDKRKCFVGEAVLATFKLYSRLESKSDIVKNPGFYGFAVYDMVNLSSKEVSTEEINGKPFDVHTIRKIQLYPQQAGNFSIDAMEVKNRVEFSRSAVSKKTEQEIVEGVLGRENDESPPMGSEVFENEISSLPVDIKVKDLSEKNKPAAFTGAVGEFRVHASLTKDKLARNEEGILELTIEGRGNFIQMNAPVLHWPAGIESFDPSVTDSFDKVHTPLTGKRIFRYPFISSSPGNYIIPGLTFNFFNPDSGKYKTVKSLPLMIEISNVVIAPINSKGKKIKDVSPQGKIIWIAAAILLFSGVAGFFIFRKKNIAKVDISGSSAEVFPSAEALLAPAQVMVKGADQEFYSFLYTVIWKFFGHHFRLEGSGFSKVKLSAELERKEIKLEIIEKAKNIIQQCEEGMFTKASLNADKESVLTETRILLKSIESGLL